MYVLTVLESFFNLALTDIKGLSLYHALLSQCAKPWLSAQAAAKIEHLVRYRFRCDKRLHSPSQIEHSLKAGYEALDLLHSCSQGNTTSLKRVDSLLTQAQSLLNKPIPELPLPRTGRLQPKPDEKIKKPKPEIPKPFPILSRPRPRVNGIRRVPVFVCARGVPFLRITKPQPKRLTWAINSKLKARWDKIVRRDRLEAELLTAEDEDHWDRVVGMRDTERYASTVKDSLRDNEKALRISDAKNYDLAQKMWNVVLRERELAKKEAEERKQLEGKE